VDLATCGSRRGDLSRSADSCSPAVFAIDLLDAYVATYLREKSNTKPSAADSWSVRRST